jgi:hypothetical protein
VRHACRALTVLAFSLAFAAGPARADEATDETARRVELLLARSEAASRRPFDATFRAAAARALTALPAEELETRLAHGRGIAPLALGDSSTQLVYTPVPPCRLIDTRQAGGSLAAGVPRDFKVAGAGLQNQGGELNGCGVPVGPATAAVINFVAVNPVGPGNLRAWAYSTPPVGPPGASILNYATVPGLNIANGVVVPICDEAATDCNGLDLRVQADVSNTQLVADVVGFFERFPREQTRSFSVLAVTNSEVVIGSTCTTVPLLNVAITAPTTGKVVVRANLSGFIDHATGGMDEMSAHIGLGPADCTSPFPAHAVSQGVSSGNYSFVLPVVVAFDVPPGTHTYYANAIMRSQSGGINRVNFFGRSSSIEATFHPN